MTAKIYSAKEFNLRPEDADPHAIDITIALQNAGYTAYIVGGGVRDLLLGLSPKDFDVATSATPEQVKKLFSNCRLIGRRFRLAHVFFRRHIVEVATYRGDHSKADHEQQAYKADDGIIMRDNVYGTLEDDAWRRDLTINALYYDPVKEEILDFTGGMEDFHNKKIKLIGDADMRFQEDPVRILRALRFMAKLSFTLDPATEKAIQPDLALLKKISPGRIFDEYMKLFLHGSSVPTFELLQQYGLTEYLFPQMAERLNNGHILKMVKQALANTDRRVNEGMSINPAFLIAVFLWSTVGDQHQKLMKEHFSQSDAFNKAVSETLSQQMQATAVPRRFSRTIREIWSFQYILERRRPRQVMPILHHKKFRAAFDFLLLRSQFGEVSKEVADWWELIQTQKKSAQKQMILELSGKATPPKEPWSLLIEQRKASPSIAELFAFDADRAADLQINAAGIHYDFSKTTLSDESLQTLLLIAENANLSDAIAAMFRGDNINNTENRAVLHTALRNRSDKAVMQDKQNIMPMIQAQLDKMSQFVDAIYEGKWTGHTGEKITHVINIGIGGSDLGPHMAVKALAPYHSGQIECHFVSNVDATNLLDALQQCPAANTLFVIASKTFTTQETLLNANSARQWLSDQLGKEAVAKHFVAITASPEKAVQFGIQAENCFEMWNFVGGRYSMWSTIGLPIALTIGMDNFYGLLQGASEMDEHFANAPLAENMPVIFGLAGIWHRNINDYNNYAVLPYDQRLSLFPSYLQQLDMESNGKSVTRDGTKVKRGTGPIVWGSVGTNGQHAFHQLLHQGNTVVPAEFIMVEKPHHDLAEHHRVLNAHCRAQIEALMHGKCFDTAMAELIEQGMDINDAEQLAPHKVIAGNKPSQLLKVEQLTPQTLGALIALYEHKVFVQSVIWNINAFDQWGVELGKQLANEILAG